MPKIIENAKRDLIAKTRQLVTASGYSSFSMREVAKLCGLAPGTIYNYFHSKDDLIAASMQQDWDIIINDLGESTKDQQSVLVILEDIHKGILGFCHEHEKVIKDPEAGVNYFSHFSHYHAKLIQDIHELLESAVKETAVSYTPLLTDFLAETVLNWAVRDIAFCELETILKPLFK